MLFARCNVTVHALQNMHLSVCESRQSRKSTVECHAVAEIRCSAKAEEEEHNPFGNSPQNAQSCLRHYLELPDLTMIWQVNGVCSFPLWHPQLWHEDIAKIVGMLEWNVDSLGPWHKAMRAEELGCI